MHCKTITILLRIRAGGHFVKSITKNHESHYVTVLENPQHESLYWDFNRERNNGKWTLKVANECLLSGQNSPLSFLICFYALIFVFCYCFFFRLPFQWINDKVPREPESFLFAHRHEAMSDLIYLLGHLVDVKGKILVPGINDNVAPLTDGERATYTDIDFDKVHFVTIIESKMLLRASFSCWDSFSQRRTTFKIFSFLDKLK